MQRRIEIERDEARAREAIALQRLDEAERCHESALAALGHDLRNALGSMMISVELLKRQTGGGADSRPIRSLERQSRNVLTLVDTVVDVSRLRRSKIELQRSAIDLRDPIAKAVLAAESNAESRRQELSYTPPDAPVMIFGDASRIEQLVHCLIENACKHTPPRGSIIVALQGGASAAITVKDTGVGMSEALAARVFDLFALGRDGLPPGGPGVGLTLVRGLVELHGGTITATSDGPQSGSTFTVCLPLADDSSSRADHVDSADHPPSSITLTERRRLTTAR